jgi:hypothetical protein
VLPRAGRRWPEKNWLSEKRRTLWSKIKRHKLSEWSLAYVAFGYVTLHGAEMPEEAFNWSEIVRAH